MGEQKTIIAMIGRHLREQMVERGSEERVITMMKEIKRRLRDSVSQRVLRRARR